MAHGHILDIGPHLLAEVGDFVDKRNITKRKSLEAYLIISTVSQEVSL
jgi:hypothetical protein